MFSQTIARIHFLKMFPECPNILRHIFSWYYLLFSRYYQSIYRCRGENTSNISNETRLKLNNIRFLTAFSTFVLEVSSVKKLGTWFLSFSPMSINFKDQLVTSHNSVSFRLTNTAITNINDISTSHSWF